MKHWYLIAYDIREQKRLRRVHYFLKKNAIALQNSVFLLQADKKTLDEILVGIKTRVKGYNDDVRLYPIATPHSIWSAGKQTGVMQNLYIGQPIKKQNQSILQGIIHNLFGRR